MKNQSVNRSLEIACSRLAREVREHPLLSLGLAVGAGALLGTLVGHATATSGRRHHWLIDAASNLPDHAHQAADRVRRAARQTNKELHAAARRTSDTLPEVDLDQFVSRGRHWLRSKLA